jgi:hypothetical protein
MVSLFRIQISVRDPDPHSAGISIIFGSWIRIRIKVKSWIRIRIKMMRIRNPDPAVPKQLLRQCSSRFLKNPVFRIYAILVRIRIWIRGSMPLTNGSGSGSKIKSQRVTK